MPRLLRLFTRLAFAVVLAVSIIVCGGSVGPDGQMQCAADGECNNLNCEVQNETWADLAAPDVDTTALQTAGCTMPRLYTHDTKDPDSPAWAIARCPDPLDVDAGAVYSFDGTWDRCSGQPAPGTADVTWEQAGASPGGGGGGGGCASSSSNGNGQISGCHTPDCGALVPPKQ